jgi:Bacterial protein of unknown function (DUF899)
MAVAFPGESAEYRVARNLLVEQEIELRRAMEAVAEARRRLPPGGVVPEDYVFQAPGPDGTSARVRLSELFAPGKNSLVIYSMMFPRAADDKNSGQTALLPLAEGPCPSCTTLLDQLDGARRASQPARQPRGRREGAARARREHAHIGPQHPAPGSRSGRRDHRRDARPHGPAHDGSLQARHVRTRHRAARRLRLRGPDRP